MAEELKPTLADLFASKGKRKPKGSNLNTDKAKPVDGEEEKKGPAKKGKEEEGWEEEQIAATSLKVEVAGKLIRDDDKKDEEDSGVPAWGNTRKNTTGPKAKELNEKYYPTLAKTVLNKSSINIDDGTRGTINIATSKNAFQSLRDEDDDEEDEVKRPREIKPAGVQKAKGEMVSTAVNREVDKYRPGGGKKKKDEDDEEADSDDEAPKEVKKKKKEQKKQEKGDAAAEKEMEEDVMIAPDLQASRDKYTGREKLPHKELPKSELMKEVKVANLSGVKKKKVFVEESSKPKPQMMVLED